MIGASFSRSPLASAGNALARGERLNVFLVIMAALIAAPAFAHDPAEKTYDRTVVVRLTPHAVVVDYTLEVNAYTAYSDAASFLPPAELRTITDPEPVYLAFRKGTANQIAGAVLARLDGKAQVFTCTRQRHRLVDQEREPVGEAPGKRHAHLRCEFRLEAPWEPAPEREHQFTFREANYDQEKGSIRLSLVAEDGVTMRDVTQPDEALMKRPFIELGPKDEDRLRTVSASFEVTGEAKPAAPAAPEPEDEPVASRPQSLQDLLFHSRMGLWMLLGLATLFGAAHALTPGHGKTLVAAYLVGQRGTVGHAILLGLVTTLTHTGVILLLAAVLYWKADRISPSDMQVALGFLGGLMIAGLGFWLLQRRLAGKADHFHIGGGHHHHHGDDHHHHGEAVSLRGLIVLGISGGIVPCGEALTLFLLAVQWQRLDLALPLLLAFSAGLASVLVLIGVGVVYARKLAIARWGESPGLKRIARVIPIVSAIAIIALGLWLCYHSVHGSP
jgi:ABC-type nickel/cobalt efflux system permease component RcnA